MHFGPHKTWICFCFRVHWCKFYPFPKIPPPPGGWLTGIKMDILRRGEYGRRIRKAKQGGSVAPEAVGEKHCAWRRPLAHTVVSWRVVGAGFSLGPRSDAALCVSDADGNLCRSNQLLQVMLTMHRVIISSAELLQKVIALYPFSRLAGSPQWECSRVAGNRKYAFILIGLE